jgi:hypothetical protein
MSKKVFKKFSDFKNKESEIKEVTPSDLVDNLPANPNLSNNNSKKEVTIDGDDSLEKEEDKKEDKKEVKEAKVETIGKVAKFPKNTKASKAYNFMENVKISKKSIWYIMVEKMDNELQLVKYNYNEGVDLAKFVAELKTYYLNTFKDNKAICEAVNKLTVDGNDKYSMVKNITAIDINGKKLITKITEDLIKLLSK